MAKTAREEYREALNAFEAASASYEYDAAQGRDCDYEPVNKARNAVHAAVERLIAEGAQRMTEQDAELEHGLGEGWKTPDEIARRIMRGEP